MYADDLCIFSPSVSGLRKLMHCCEKYGDIFNITYNVNKSYCMVIDNKSQNIKYTHPVTLNNNVLPYTTKCKYLGHIINNNLTDDVCITFISDSAIQNNIVIQCWGP